jgi:hypothetical protein
MSLKKTAAESGNLLLMTKLLNHSPALTDHDFGMYIQAASYSKSFDKITEGWSCLKHVYGRSGGLNPKPDWTSKVKPTEAKIPHQSYFCIYIDALGYSTHSSQMLQDEWKQVEEWHHDAQKKYSTNLCTSYVEALLRKGSYEDASEFVFGSKDQLDVVRKYKIKLDEKFIRTYASFFKRLHHRSLDKNVLEQFRKKWPKLEIDLKTL